MIFRPEHGTMWSKVESSERLPFDRIDYTITFEEEPVIDLTGLTIRLSLCLAGLIAGGLGALGLKRGLPKLVDVLTSRRMDDELERWRELRPRNRHDH